MKISQIDIADVKKGLNWRLTPESPICFDARMPDWEHVDVATNFGEEDLIIYSGLVVFPSGMVMAILLCKQVAEIGYGGDYCEYHRGNWKAAGIMPNPSREIGREYIANPLELDPSFGDVDSRREQREGFQRHIAQLSSNGRVSL